MSDTQTEQDYELSELSSTYIGERTFKASVDDAIELARDWVERAWPGNFEVKLRATLKGPPPFDPDGPADWTITLTEKFGVQKENEQ